MQNKVSILDIDALEKSQALSIVDLYHFCCKTLENQF